MGGIYSYDEAVADSAHGDIGTVKAGVQSSLDDLGGFVSKVTASWTGDEQTEYAGIQHKWDSAAATVQEILNSVHTALGTNTTSVKEMRGQVKGALHSS